MGDYFNGSIGRITGLDPAYPLFSPNDTDRLSPDCAKFVDAIHTDYPKLGEQTPSGTADYYPNYGRSGQPGCEILEDSKY